VPHLTSPSPPFLSFHRTKTLKGVILSEATRAFASYAAEGPAVAFVFAIAFLACHPEGDLLLLLLLPFTIFLFHPNPHRHTIAASSYPIAQSSLTP
jgi:hypothetical protein